MKPRLRMYRGLWECGLLCDTRLYWAQGRTPAEALYHWKRSRE